MVLIIVFGVYYAFFSKGESAIERFFLVKFLTTAGAASFFLATVLSADLL